MSKKTILFFAVLLFSIFSLPFISVNYAGTFPGNPPPSAPFDLRYVPGELLVKFAPKADGIQLSKAEKNQIMSFLGEAKVKGNYKIVPGLCHVTLPAGVTVEHAIEHLNTKEGIMYAQPNHYLMLCSIPNDPEFGNLWGMHNNGGGGRTLDADIDAPEAWNIETDAGDIIVAVIDSGVDYNHEDLAANMWINPGEDHPPLGVGPEDFDGVNDDENYDNEGNPLIDDLYGYDFCSTDNEDGEYGRDSDPMDSHENGGHGTLMAGVIGAVGNNGIGVTGVCWNVKIMALRAFPSNATPYFGVEADAIACIDYAILMGAKVTSNSWGRYYNGPPYYALANAIARAGENGVLFVAAVNNFGDNVDNKPFYPACYPLSNIISVMATDWDDERSVWGEGSSSNYGAVSVDLAAPGSVIMSCRTGGGYQFANGTSMSTPFVSGACALVWAANPLLSHLEVKGIILNTVDVKAQLLDDPQLGRLCVTGGRLNLNNAVREAVEFPTDDELVGSWRLNEGQGTIAYDSAGDNDGTLGAFPSDPAWHNDTRHGWCLDFDREIGEEDKVSLSPIIALMTDSVTISAWIRTDDASTQNIFTQYNGLLGYRLYLHWYQNANSLRPSFQLLTVSAEADNVPVNQWFHLAGTYDGSNLRIYVDGVEEDIEPCSGQKGFYGDAYISHDHVSNNHFIGQIDDVRVYNYALDLFGIWDAMTGDLPRFRINNSEDETVAWFDSLGNLFLEGGLEKESDFVPSTGHNEFVVKRANGYELAVIDTTNGNMYIRGKLYTEQPMLYPAGFKVINMYGGSYIDNSDDYLGYLVMTGQLYELNPLP